MEEVEVSPPQPLEIRIKVVCTSLCRSDLTAWQSLVGSLSLGLWKNISSYMASIASCSFRGLNPVKCMGALGVCYLSIGYHSTWHLWKNVDAIS